MDIGAYESTECEAPTPFQRLDSSTDGAANLTDAVLVLNYLFRGGPPPGCLDAADADDSGGLDIIDPVYGLNFLFLGGTPPPAPFPECGIDRTPDSLGCETAPLCR